MSQSLSTRFWSKVNIVDFFDCWAWTASTNHLGYGRISINRKNRYATRIAWELTYGKISLGQCVLHKCDNPICVNPNHLFLGTMQDNTIDMCKKGRQRGHLSKEDIIAIRLMRHEGCSLKEIASCYNIHYSTVSRIAIGHRGIHI